VGREIRREMKRGWDMKRGGDGDSGENGDREI
jgi:hypothetical protein